MESKPNTINPFRQYLIVPIPQGVASYRGISPGAKLVYGRLQRYAGKKGVAFPHIPELAEEVGLGERQTREYLSELVKEKLISRDRVFGQGNVYSFLQHPCLEGTEIGSPRPNLGSFSNRRYTAGQPNGRYTADANRRDPASWEGSASLLYEEGQKEEGQEEAPTIPPSEENQAPEPSPILDSEPTFEASTMRPPRKSGPFRNGRKPVDPEKESRREFKRSQRELLNGSTAHRPEAKGFASALAAPPTPPASPTVDYASLWNQINPDNPVDSGISASIAKRCFEDPFPQKADEVFQKCHTLLAAGASVGFTSLFRRDRETGLFGWQRVLANEYDWMLKTKSAAKKNELSFLDKYKKEIRP